MRSIIVFILLCQVIRSTDGKSVSRYSSSSSSSSGDIHQQQQHVHHHHLHQDHGSHLSSPSSSSFETDTVMDLPTKSSGDSPMGCKELRSKRYISDGACTSIKPITEVVCAGVCLPVSKLPWYSDYAGLWSRPDEDGWQCVDDAIKRKRVHLVCQDGQQRSYTIRTVRSCKCKKRKRFTTNRTISAKRKS